MAIRRLTALPPQLQHLIEEARAEGFRNMDVLATEWETGANRFDRAGEMLVAEMRDDQLAGIGGLSVDLVDPAWLRMRRFYVLPAFRRRGIGRSIAENLIAHTTLPNSPIAVRSENAAAFWEALGFRPTARENTTHVLWRPAS